MENFWIQLLITTGVIASAVATFTLGIKNLKDQNCLIMQKLEGLNATVVSSAFDIKDIKFEREILNVMRAETAHIISYSKSLDQPYKDSMMYFCRAIEDIVLNYYYSHARGDKNEIEKIVVCQFNALKREFYSYLYQNFTHKKSFTYDTGRKDTISFSKYISDSNLKDKIELLIIKLIENGYTDDKKDKFKSDIKSFLNSFFERYVDLIVRWQELSNNHE